MITIFNVSPDQFGQLEAKLATRHDAEVVQTSPNTGTIKGHGVLATFAYRSDARTLTVEVTKHPFFVTEGAVESGLRKALGA